MLPIQPSRILVAGAHPDDPEGSCGGAILRFIERGHEVVVAYLTRGEAGIAGTSAAEAAAIRTAEAKAACALLGARPLFLGQTDGQCEVTAPWYQDACDRIAAEQPDILLTQWPIDTHRDHRACGLLVYEAWLRMDPRPLLYFYETATGWQTQQFQPTHYLDITAVRARKHEAFLAHRSQRPEQGWQAQQERMERFRGLERGCEFAEAFILHAPSTGGG